MRYEGQVKQRQQRELAETIIAKIDKELEDPKVLKRILDQSVADVEREYLVMWCKETVTDMVQASSRSRSRLTGNHVRTLRHCNIPSIDELLPKCFCAVIVPTISVCLAPAIRAYRVSYCCSLVAG